MKYLPLDVQKDYLVESMLVASVKKQAGGMFPGHSRLL